MAAVRRRTRRASTTPDMSRMSRAVQRPGIDPRVWCVRGWVKAYHLDADHGAFVDVLLQTGEEETARVGEGYAGAGYGDHGSLQADDEVLMVAPMGNYNSGLVVVARLHSKSDPPSQIAADHPQDRLVHLKSGQTLRVVVEGAGNAVLAVDAGRLLLATEQADQRFLRGDDYQQAQLQMLQSWQAFLGALGTYAGAIQPIADPGGAATTALGTAMGTLAAAFVTFNNATLAALSQKIRGV